MILDEKNNTDKDFHFLKIILSELKKLNSNPLNPWIEFPKVRHRLGTLYHMKKQNSWKLIFLLKKRGFIEVNRIKGIKIKGENYGTNH